MKQIYDKIVMDIVEGRKPRITAQMIVEMRNE